MKLINEFGVLLLIALSIGMNAHAATSPDWQPESMDTIRGIYESKTLTDDEIVSALIRQLDKRITMARLFPGHTNPSPAYEYANLLALIAERPYPASPQYRPESIHKAIAGLSNGEIQNITEVRSLLNIALGLAGEARDAQLLAFLENPNGSPAIIQSVLNAMAHSHVPVRALPRLLVLADDPTNSIDPARLGHPTPERIFPIREAVMPCLEKLHVKAVKTNMMDAQADKWGRRFSTTVIKVDRRALVENLRQRLQSDNLADKSDALEAAQQIGGDDMKAMLHEESSRK